MTSRRKPSTPAVEDRTARTGLTGVTADLPSTNGPLDGGKLLPALTGPGDNANEYYLIREVLNTINPDGQPVVFCPGERAPDWLVAAAKSGELVDTDAAEAT